MFISVDGNATLVLREPHDFKRLHIEAGGDMTRESVAAALGQIATIDNDGFWVELEALKALSGCAGDTAWERGFAAMIMSVQKFGWLSPDGRHVRCHLKSK